MDGGEGKLAGEGGGALISQAIHQVDVLLSLVGAVDEVFVIGGWAPFTKSNPRIWYAQ